MYGAAGLGLLVTSATGIQSMGMPSCITQAEKDEANAKCPPATVLRGLGAGPRSVGAMSGRLASIDPCLLADLPVCPMPKCIDQYTAGVISQCIAGSQSNPDYDCSSLAMYALSELPFCGGADGAGLGAIPKCLDAGAVQIRDYCLAHPRADGPNKGLNAVAWLVMHDAVYKAKFLATPPCYNPPVTVTPPVTHYHPDATPVPVTPPPPPTSGSGANDASMSGMMGILALVAVAGGGYYMYRRYKR